MENEEILATFYENIMFKHSKKGWVAAFNPLNWRGVKAEYDLVDAKTGKVVVETGTKITPRLTKKLAEEGHDVIELKRKIN